MNAGLENSATPLPQPVASVPQILRDMTENSVPLGAEFEAAMMENLTSLYECDNEALAALPDQDVEEFIAEKSFPLNSPAGVEVMRVVKQEDLRTWMAGHVRVPVEKIALALGEVREVLQKAYSSAYPVCCGRPVGAECCGSPVAQWSKEDEEVMNVFGPVERSLASMLAASQEGV